MVAESSCFEWWVDLSEKVLGKESTEKSRFDKVKENEIKKNK